MINLLRKDFQNILVNIMDKVNALTTALDLSFQPAGNLENYELNCVVPSDVSYDDLEQTKNCLIAYRQYEITTR